MVVSTPRPKKNLILKEKRSKSEEDYGVNRFRNFLCYLDNMKIFRDNNIVKDKAVELTEKNCCRAEVRAKIVRRGWEHVNGATILDIKILQGSLLLNWMIITMMTRKLRSHGLVLSYDDFAPIKHEKTLKAIYVSDQKARDLKAHLKEKIRISTGRKKKLISNLMGEITGMKNLLTKRNNIRCLGKF
ncbi:hypothetical protein RJT34_20064 [Clitoria ternatea]|uniref:Uncharacterized protein n=1 Tax=Clitoria ternatea TaxID=43366 RepID=A0AAN9ISN0_CLITE